MRLIDADEMLLNESKAYMKAQSKCDDLTAKINQVVHMKIQQLIHDTPTAYDVDKVVERMIEEADNTIVDFKKDKYIYTYKAIEIVRAGGKDE